MSVIPFPSSASPAFPACETVGRPSEATAPRASLPALWLRRWRGRKVLAALSPDQIRDADLDPYAVRLEATKPFWRA
ncbi:DUF1127 domain-containing protein [Methylobacterium aerolatum]|uniref:Uncharacterized protein YjiS (DUF1127 family) n=1 Tax=Methylobacterium aerolatum TaxID=418708 RepID=A0ABU0I127_9HYPH|nr:translation initiation factor IF-2 [Methylobacterium aerolatum]MDQ0448296.1 uncharacterized protein YjiS (DUF1127 family) [Methylobacterium aerolatum]GJD35701.1 hypothetical protein FMGBMHLM_2613 [Methylobacterium aerolatum]